MKNEILFALHDLLEEDSAVERVDLLINHLSRDQVLVIHFKDGTVETLNCAGYRDVYNLYRIGKLFEERGEFR